MAEVTVKVMDMEPVQKALSAMAAAVAEFAKISDEEMWALPLAARLGIGILMDAAQEFSRPRLTICQHRTAGWEDRGRNCPECGLPMLYVPAGN